MKSKVVERLFEEMKRDGWWVKLRRWVRLKIWVWGCLTRKYWDKSYEGYLFRSKKGKK
jgi:hypothetical protein